MAAGDSQAYGAFALSLMKGDNLVDFDTDTIKVALTTSSYTPDIDTHEFFDDVTNELAAGDGYTAGGETVASGAVSYDSANNQAEFDCADVAFPFTATKAPKWAIVYKSTGTAGTSPLIGYIDCGTVSTDQTFTVRINTNGLVNFRAQAETA